jgi:hypothetical protein
MVSVPESLVPALMLAPLATVTFSVPFCTLSWVLARLPSGSVTLRPEMANCVSSLADCVPGTELTGAPAAGVCSVIALPL